MDEFALSSMIKALKFLEEKCHELRVRYVGIEFPSLLSMDEERVQALRGYKLDDVVGGEGGFLPEVRRWSAVSAGALAAAMLGTDTGRSREALGGRVGWMLVLQ